MQITHKPAIRAAPLAERGLDFADAARLFTGQYATLTDDHIDYGEERFISAGYLANRLVVLVWMPRGNARHIVSMRHAHAKVVRRWIEHPGQDRGCAGTHRCVFRDCDVARPEGTSR